MTSTSPRPSSAYGRGGSVAAAGTDVAVRLRHTAGDVGPFLVPPSTTVAALRARAHAAWPMDGPLAADAPASPSEVRLIASGRFCLDNTTVDALNTALGRPPPPLTLHVVVRRPPPPSGKAGGGGKGAAMTAAAGGAGRGDARAGGGCCGCVVQ